MEEERRENTREDERGEQRHVKMNEERQDKRREDRETRREKTRRQKKQDKRRDKMKSEREMKDRCFFFLKNVSCNNTCLSEPCLSICTFVPLHDVDARTTCVPICVDRLI